jgi:hypothetical protein
VKMPADFVHSQGKEAGAIGDADWPANSYSSVEVLPELIGKAWDARALAFVMSMRPSWIRVIGPDAGETTDARRWRITVYIDTELRIVKLEQEVEIPVDMSIVTDDLGLGWRNGYEADCWLRGERTAAPGGILRHPEANGYGDDV